jgi:hypothetical protein
MNLYVAHSRESLSEDALLGLEALLGETLPASYRNFLLEHNGGHPELDLFQLKDVSWDDYVQVDTFLCVKKDDPYNLVAWIGLYGDRIPTELIPIATDPGGNLLCLSIMGTDKGKVYLWDHENEGIEGGGPWRKNLHLVTDSFQEFIEGLS